MSDPIEELDLSAVPLFPLPNVVLFPRAVLPLHIFEERYKAMTADAIDGNRQIAMALLRPGWEKRYHERAEIEPVVCVGTILSHEKLLDGRYNFLLQGTVRARVVREFGHLAYRVAELEALAEKPAMEIDLADERRRLETIFDDHRLLGHGLARRFRELLNGSVSTDIIADLIAFNFLEDIPLKQSLLADRDVRQRVGRTVDALEALHSRLRAAVPAGFSKNPSLN
ncbi:MAG TPA: LON peptidase substrate-binding domain-containing protein [Tepidisphaeraceae bacterium]|nr:LON peptidase substrate-binding domain-containing protein [Tepidisphaeraceae bacterium]